MIHIKRNICLVAVSCTLLAGIPLQGADGNHYIISGFTDNALLRRLWKSCFHKRDYDNL